MNYACLKYVNLQAKMTMKVHDELNFTVHKTELDVVRKVVVEEVENAIKFQVSLIADCGVGANWLEAH